MMPPTRVSLRLVIGLILFSIACAKSPSGPSGTGSGSGSGSASTGTLSDYVSSGRLAGSFGTVLKPAAGSGPTAGGGPIASITSTSLVNISGGGGTTFNVSATAAFDKVFVTAPGKSGFLELDLASPKTDQGIAVFFSTLPSNPTLQFQVVAPGGAAGPLASVQVSTVAGPVAGLEASFDPDPIPFSGRTCNATNDPNFGCVYQSSFTLQEIGGVAINVAQYQATWNFGGSATPTVFTSPTLPGGASVIPALNSTPPSPMPLFVRCSTPTCSASFFASTNGTMFFTIAGTDATGHPVNFRSPNITLLAAP